MYHSKLGGTRRSDRMVSRLPPLLRARGPRHQELLREHRVSTFPSARAATCRLHTGLRSRRTSTPRRQRSNAQHGAPSSNSERLPEAHFRQRPRAVAPRAGCGRADCLASASRRSGCAWKIYSRVDYLYSYVKVNSYAPICHIK